jgi:hypothetical protein
MKLLDIYAANKVVKCADLHQLTERDSVPICH